MNFMKWNSGKSNANPSQGGTGGMLPDSPEMMFKLAETINQVHVLKGAESPISQSLATELSSKLELARKKHEEGMKHLQAANELFKERDSLLGVRQQSGPAGASLKYYVSCAREIVSRVSDNNEKTMNEWGFR